MKCFKIFFKHTWHPQQMIVVPSPASIWDYPQMDQLSFIVGLIYDAGPDSQREYFPSAKNRIPSSRIDGTAKFEPAKIGFKGVETELGEIKVMVPETSMQGTNATSRSDDTSRIVACGSGGCKNMRNRDEPIAESPWHVLKTIFLVSVIVALIVWIIIYTLLAQYEIL